MMWSRGNAARGAAFSFWFVGTALAFALMASAVMAADNERLAEPNQEVRLIVVRTNAVREREGRAPLASESSLTQAAGEFARFMANSEKYAHDADGRQPQQRAREHGYDYCIVLENIARQFRSGGFSVAELAQAFVAGWERSPGHRRNMLHPEVTHIGVGVARNERSGYYYAVQLFGRPRSEIISFSVTNKTGADVAYRVGARRFSLQSGSTRTHQQCASERLEFQSTTALPKDGERFAIRSAGSGRTELRKD